MSYKLTKCLAEIFPYNPIQGEFKMRLDGNESFINMPEYLTERIKKAVADIEYNRYPDPYSTEVIKAFSAFYGIAPKYVTAGNGSDELIALLISCFASKNANICFLSQDFSMYKFYSSLYGKEAHSFAKFSDLTVDIKKLINFCNSHKTRLLIFSNPCNPTSLGITRDEVCELLRSLPNTLIIVDEAYMDFWNQSMLTEFQAVFEKDNLVRYELDDFDNLVVLKTCSKAFGAAAVRLGFAVASETITRALRAAKSPYNVNAVTQKIGEILLYEKDLLKDCVNRITASRNELLSEFLAIKSEFVIIDEVYDSKTNFIYIKTKKFAEIYQNLLTNGILVRKFEDYLRVSAGSAEENAAVIKTVRDFLIENWEWCIEIQQQQFEKNRQESNSP